METIVENVNDADVLMPNAEHESADEKLEPGIGSDTGLYSVLFSYRHFESSKVKAPPSF